MTHNYNNAHPAGCGCSVCASQDDNDHLTSYKNETADISIDSDAFVANDSGIVTAAFTSGATFETQTLLSGISWTGTSGVAATVRYTFNENFFSGSASQLSGEQQVAAVQALQQWSNVANIQFVQDSSNADLALRQDALGTNVLGVSTTSFSGAEMRQSEVRVSSSETGFAPGGSGFHTFLHEIGHSIGLKHPGDFGDSSDKAPFIVPSENSWDASVMSYNTGAYTSGGNRPTGPMIYDIAAAQYLYGVNTSYNAGNTVYSFNGQQQAMAIWDGGGSDMIDSTPFGGGVIIDLREGVGNVTTIGASAIWMAFGANIENASSGAGNDSLYGNALGNSFYAGGGNDNLYGEQGNDFLQGNQGNDLLYGGDGNDTIEGGKDSDTINGNQGNDVVNGNNNNDNVEGGKGDDIVRGGKNDDIVNGNFGNDFVYGDLGNDIVRGGKDQDQLFGGDGNDTLLGDMGNDVMSGNAGQDIFVFNPTSGIDTIMDFEQPGAGIGDIIQISSLLMASREQALSAISYTGAGAVIDLGGGNQVTLVGITSGLTIDDFSII